MADENNSPTKQKKLKNNQKHTIYLNRQQIKTLDTIPIFTRCYSLVTSSKQIQIYIFWALYQPEIGLTCGCVETHFGVYWEKHFKKCTIAKQLIDGIEPTGGTTVVSRLKKLKEYQELLEKPIFEKTAWGQITMRFHHQYGYVCPSCGKRSKSCNSLLEAHHKKVDNCLDPISWKILQPPMDYFCNTVEAGFC